MECDHVCFDFSVHHVDFVANEDDGYIFKDSYNVAIMVRYIFVRHSARHIEHNDGAVRSDPTKIKSLFDANVSLD